MCIRDSFQLVWRGVVVISSTAFNSDIWTVVGWYSSPIFLQLSVMTLCVLIHDDRLIHKVKYWHWLGAADFVVLVWFCITLTTFRHCCSCASVASTSFSLCEGGRGMVVISSTAFNSDIWTVVCWYSSLIFLQLSVMTLCVLIHDDRLIHKVKSDTD